MDADNPFAAAEVLARRPASAPTTGWEYLVQMAPIESSMALGFGANSRIRQPLQPLTAVPGQLAQSQLQLQQQLMSKQKLQGQWPVPQHAQQQQQEVEQRQPEAASLPNGALSALPYNAEAQQQQVYAAEVDKEIAIQQAVSTLSEAELTQQLLAIAKSASRPDRAATDGTAAMHANGVNGNGIPSKSSKSPETHADGLKLQSASDLMSNGFQHLNGSHSEHADANLSKNVKHEGNGPLQQPSPWPQSSLPAPAPTPFLTQQLPQQAISLSSLIPNRQQAIPSASQGLAAMLGSGTRQMPGAGPSREGTPTAQGHATWVHESQLPLWLVRTFEETRRRDVAMVAARAAQQAQRDANAAHRAFASNSQPWRSECKTFLLPQWRHFLVLEHQRA